MKLLKALYFIPRFLNQKIPLNIMSSLTLSSECRFTKKKKKIILDFRIPRFVQLMKTELA